MIPLRESIIHDQLSLFSDSQAQIHIITRNRQIRIKTSETVKILFGDHQARPCHGIVVHIDPGADHESVIVPAYSRKYMLCISLESQHYSGMLNRVVGIEKLCSHNSHIVSDADAQHFRNGILADHLGVIVEE